MHNSYYHATRGEKNVPESAEIGNDANDATTKETKQTIFPEITAQKP